MSALFFGAPKFKSCQEQKLVLRNVAIPGKIISGPKRDSSAEGLKFKKLGLKLISFKLFLATKKMEVASQAVNDEQTFGGFLRRSAGSQTLNEDELRGKIRFQMMLSSS